MRIERFEHIEAWKVARELTRTIYGATTKPLFAKDFGLKDQIQRASVSIMANIAEGFDSTSDQGFVQFLGYALRSATEVKSHPYVALDQNYISEDEFDRVYEQTTQVKRMIMGFIRYLRSKDA